MITLRYLLDIAIRVFLLTFLALQMELPGFKRIYELPILSMPKKEYLALIIILGLLTQAGLLHHRENKVIESSKD